MNKIVVVGSSIQAREGRFTYSNTRSLFSNDERSRQTVFTVNSLRNALPDAKIVIVDSSNDYIEYISNFSVMKNVQYIPLKDLSYTAFEDVNTHLNKSYCESKLLNTFYTHFKKELINYDYIIKATGRYFYFDFDNSMFNNTNTDKILFKKPLQFNWSDTWRYSYVDRRSIQGDNALRQYCTVLYAFASQHLEKMIDINEAAIQLINTPEMAHYDIETLSYYLTRPFEDKIVETEWRVSGWDGVSGKFMYY